MNKGKRGILVLLFIAFIVIICVILVPLIQKENPYNFEIQQTLQKHDILEEDSNIKNKVTRSECIEAVMKVLGANKEANEDFFQQDVEYTIYQDIIDDENFGYIQTSFFMDISCGRAKTQKWQGEKVRELYFCPDEKVTLKEACAFIVRSLEQYSIQDILYDDEVKPSSLRKTYKRAKELGIIQSTDSFYSILGGRKITYEDLSVLLYRMLNQPRYWYIEKSMSEWASFPSWNYKTDEDRSMTYREFLDKRRDE